MTLRDLLDTTHREAAHAISSWKAATDATTKDLGHGVARTLDLHTSKSRIDVAFRALADALERPTLVIATTGTTSGGKSAIVNLLCGAQLMPSAVQEMSAGVVTIEHDPARKMICIEATPGATWTTGEWEETPDQIRRRLREVMDAYRDHRSSPGIEPPRFRIRFPTHLGTSPERFGLPGGSRVVLIDLPGLNHTGDARNSIVIHEQIRHALCLVTYNCAETNAELQGELLEQIVRQVRHLGGSPARMLFLANRIDVFLDDENPATERERFVMRLTDNIRRRVAEELPEHAGVAAGLTVHPLSSEPALLAVLAASSDESVRASAIERLDTRWQCLIPKEVRRILPRNIAQLSPLVRKQLVDAVFSASHADTFEIQLQQHIVDNLPALILPHLIADVRDALVDSLSKLEAELRGRKAVALDGFAAENNRLEDARSRLSTLRKELETRLEPLMSEALFKGKDIVLKLPLATAEVAKRNQLKPDVLAPLHSWQEAFTRTANEVLRALEKGLKNHGALADKLLPYASPPHREALALALAGLTNVGYSGQQATVEEAGESGKKRLKETIGGLRKLARTLVPVMLDSLDAAARQESDRIVDALKALLLAQTTVIDSEATLAAPELRGLHVSPGSVERIDEAFHWDIDFVIEAEIDSETRVEVTITKTVTKSRRSWWSLWLYEEKWQEEEDVWDHVTYHSVELPGLQDLSEMLLQQFFASRPEDKFLRWLQRQLTAYGERVRKFHDTRLQDYLKALVRAREDAVRDRDGRVAVLSSLSQLTETAFAAAKVLGGSR